MRLYVINSQIYVRINFLFDMVSANNHLNLFKIIKINQVFSGVTRNLMIANALKWCYISQAFESCLLNMAINNWKVMRSGGLRGLQNRCRPIGRGKFDSCPFRQNVNIYECCKVFLRITHQ